MVDENITQNPTVEGSNATSRSNSFRTVIEEEKDSGEEILSSDYDSDSEVDYELWLGKETGEKFKELEKINKELEKIEKEKELLNKKLDDWQERFEKTNDQKELQKLENERLEIFKEHGELIELVKKRTQARKEFEKQLGISDSEDESENEEENSQDKGKGKEVVRVRDQELVKLETSLTNWINEGKELTKAEIQTQGTSGIGVAAVGTILGSSLGGTGAIIGTAILPVVGTAIGAGIGILLGGVGGTTALVNEDGRIREKQTKEQLEKIVLDLTKREQEEKNNLIKYLTIVKEKMDGQNEKIEKLESEKAGLIERLGNANEEATELKGKLKEQEEKWKSEKEQELEKEKKNAERVKKEKEQEAEIKKRKGEIQNALQSAEKVEIEKLKEESQKANRTAEQLAEDLKAWIKAYEEKALGEQLAIAGMEEIFSVVKQRNATIDQRDAEIKQKTKEKEIVESKLLRTEIEGAQLRNDIIGLQGNINTQKIEIKNLTNSRDNARKERDAAREELGKLKVEKIQLEHDKNQAEEAKAEAERIAESLGYPKWFQRTTEFLGVESANQIWGKGVFIGRFALLILVGAILFYLGSWILRILVGTFKNLKAIFTKKQDTATVLKEMLTGMKEAKDSVIKKVKRVKKAPVEEVKEVEVIEEISSEKTDPISEDKESKKTTKKRKNKNKENSKK